MENTTTPVRAGLKLKSLIGYIVGQLTPKSVVWNDEKGGNPVIDLKNMDPVNPKAT